MFWLILALAAAVAWETSQAINRFANVTTDDHSDVEE